MSSIHNIEDASLTLHVFITDTFTAHPSWAKWKCPSNEEPAFTDAEVLTIALMQGCLGCATLKQPYLFIAHNPKGAFPKLCSYPRFIARLHALRQSVSHLVQAAKALHYNLCQAKILA